MKKEKKKKETESGNTIQKNLSSIFKGIRAYGQHLFGTMAVLTISSFLLPLLGTVISSTAVGMIVNKIPLNRFALVTAALVGLYAVLSIGKMLGEKFYYQRLNMTKVRQYTIPLCEKILTTDYENIESGENQKKFRAAIHSIRGNGGPEKLMFLLPGLAINFMGLLTYSALILRVSFLVLAVLVGMTGINAWLNWRARKYQQDHWSEKWDEVCRAAYVYRRSVNADQGKDIRMYGIEKWFHGLFEDITEKEVRWHTKVELRYLIPHVSDSLFLCLRDLIAYGVLVGMFLEGQVDAAGFTFYLGIVTGFSAWLNGFVEAAASMARANMELNQYLETQRITDKANHGQGLDVRKLKTPLEITFSHVNFRYPGSEKDTLHDLSFTIRSGEKIALVGTNGAGKTTIVKLLCGFYRPDSGEIRVNGHLISEFNLEEYQTLIGVAFQDIMTLAFTIEENITGNPLEKEDDVNRAAYARTAEGGRNEQQVQARLRSCLEKAGLWEKINSLSGKTAAYLGTDLSLDGVGLSGGELQKLIFARALYKDAPLLILDEPTSALDPLAEAALYQGYYDLTKKKTSIFISHRLSSTRFCDRIFFLNDGAVQESGSHVQLMEKGGDYARMYEIQSHYYREEQMNSERREAAYE